MPDKKYTEEELQNYLFHEFSQMDEEDQLPFNLPDKVIVAIQARLLAKQARESRALNIIISVIILLALVVSVKSMGLDIKLLAYTTSGIVGICIMIALIGGFAKIEIGEKQKIYQSFTAAEM